MQAAPEAKRDAAVSLIRLLAISAIVACHLLQYAGSELAWWLNVGVQVFLCISGWLYGGKKIENALGFYKKQFGKILLEYELVAVTALFFYWMFAWELVGVKMSIGVLLGCATLPGGGHLWFVATILFCYLLTPLLTALYDRVRGKGVLPVVGLTLLLLLALFALTLAYVPYFHAAVLSCFLCGFALRRLREEKGCRAWVYAVFFAAAALANAVQIVHQYVAPLPLPAPLTRYWEIYCEGAHALLGVSLFLILYALFSRLSFPQWAQRALSRSDAYSYDIYLVHQFWILSPFSLMGATPWVALNLVLVFLMIGFAAVLLHRTAAFFREGKRSGFGSQALSDGCGALMGFAMLWIVFFHATIQAPGEPLRFLKGMGNVGVDLFLLLSGLGLRFSWEKGGRRTGAFYRRRLLRLIPPTLLCLTPWFLYRAIGEQSFSPRFLLDIFSVSFWLDGKNPGWLVALMLVLYLAFPLIARAMERRPILAGGLMIAGVMAANAAVLALWPEWYWAVELALCRIPVFLLGAMLARPVKERRPLPVWAAGASVLCAMGLFWLLRRCPDGVFGLYAINRYLYGVLALAIALPLGTLFARRRESFWCRALSFVGTITLPIYLLHTQILAVLNQWLLPVLPSNALINAIALAVTLPLAWGISRLTAFQKKGASS